jgi:energy-converting hydrogenase Eha subunit H
VYKEAFMKSLVVAIMALPLMGGAALAAEPLSDQQMDGVNAGFTSISIADAEGLVGESGIVLTSTATLSQVNPIAIATYGETTTFLFKSLAASQSSTVTATFNPQPIPVP